MKKAIAKELELLSSPSSASVHSSEISDLENVEDDEEKQKIIEEKKEEKKVVKMFKKAIARVMGNE